MFPLLVDLLDRLRPLLPSLDLVRDGRDLDLDDVGRKVVVEGERVRRGDVSRFGMLGEDAVFAAGEGLERSSEVGCGDEGRAEDVLERRIKEG
jgi:hypothetical protein